MSHEFRESIVVDSRESLLLNSRGSFLVKVENSDLGTGSRFAMAGNNPTDISA